MAEFIYKGFSERLGANILVAITGETKEEITISIAMTSTFDNSSLDSFEVAIPREGFELVVEEGRVVGSIEDAYLELNQMDKDQCQHLLVH